MQGFQVAPRRFVEPHLHFTTYNDSRYNVTNSRSRSIVLAISSITIFIILFKFFGDVPVDYYRNYGPGEIMLPVAVDNERPQPGYFKAQPEWDFDVPALAKGYAKTPRNRDIVVLTASDGGGHNSAIPNLLEQVLKDRQAYADKHGYTNLWLNTSRYDIGDAHRVSLQNFAIHSACDSCTDYFS
jgi:hypothetical protein